MGRKRNRKPRAKRTCWKTGDQLIAERRKRDRVQIQQWETKRQKRAADQGWRDDFSSRRAEPAKTALEQLEKDFEGIPIDPQTGFPIGYLGFAVELEHRQEKRRRALERARARSAPATIQTSNRSFLDQLKKQARESCERISTLSQRRAQVLDNT